MQLKVKKKSKKQLALSNPEITRLRKAFYASLVIEDLELENLKHHVHFNYDYENGEFLIGNIDNDFKTYLLKEYGDKISFRESSQEKNIHGLSEMNETLAFLTLKIISKIYKEITRAQSNEYAFILPYAEDKLLVLEGEEDRLTLPSFPSFVFFHSHPSGHCQFSDRDWKSFVDFLINGGFVYGVISRECVYMIYKLNPISEEDVLYIKDYIDKKMYISSENFIRFKNTVGETIIKSFYGYLDKWVS